MFIIWGEAVSTRGIPEQHNQAYHAASIVIIFCSPNFPIRIWPLRPPPLSSNTKGEAVGLRHWEGKEEPSLLFSYPSQIM